MPRSLCRRSSTASPSPCKLEAVRALGAEALPYGDDLVERVRAATGGRGVDVVLDSVGKATHAASLAALAPFGLLVHLRRRQRRAGARLDR